MTLDEALAVYLFLRDVPPGKRDERAYMAAWNTIGRYAQRAIAGMQEGGVDDTNPGH